MKSAGRILAFSCCIVVQKNSDCASFLGLPLSFAGMSDFSGSVPICPALLSRPIKRTYEEHSRKSPCHNHDLEGFPSKNGKPPGFASYRRCAFTLCTHWEQKHMNKNTHTQTMKHNFPIGYGQKLTKKPKCAKCSRLP